MSDPLVLRLSIRNVATLDNGQPTMMELRQRNAIIGRLASADWCLPDPASYISSRHCEIVFAAGDYRLTDTSTNGTHLNGSPERMKGPHILNDGDMFQVGQYEIVAQLTGGNRAAAPPPAPAAWNGWEAAPAAPQASPAGWAPTPASPPGGGWGAPPPSPPADGWGAPATPLPPPPSTGGWGGGPPIAPTPAPAAGWSSWDTPAPPPDTSSGWSSAASGASVPAAEDAWGKLADSYQVDWSRGGFGDGAGSGLDSAEQAAFTPPAFAAEPAPEPTAVPGADRRTIQRRATDEALHRFLDAAGLDRAMIQGQELEVMTAAGSLLHRLVAGLVVMIEARARAKTQMGAKSTVFDRDGNNPIKFARSAEGALAQLLNPPISGYMTADRAVEDSYRDLQTHQVATLKAMQGALRATLDQFSPTAIRARAEKQTGLSRLLPGAQEAALWQAYEREFGGVARGSDEAFMDVFSKEFVRAYEELASR